MTKTIENETSAEGSPFAGLVDRQALFQTMVDRPLLVDPSHVNQFFANLVALPLEIMAQDAEVRGVREKDSFWGGWLAAYFRPYQVEDGILRIPVYGSLLDKFSLQFGDYATGYEYIRRAYLRGMDDKDVSGILLDIDSSGGDGMGNFELVAEMKEHLGTKPVHAIANRIALSGGYSIASVAESLTVTPSSQTGSVGVISVHAEVSKWLDNRGISVNVVRAGKYKAEMNSMEPLTKHARERMQARADKLYGVFVGHVAENRGLTEDAVRDTEAMVFDAQESLDIGFADHLGEMRHERARFSTRREGEQVTDKAQQTGTETQTTGTTETQATGAVDAAKAASDARIAERQRFAKVQGSDEYKGREALASHLLASTDMDADQIVGVLKTAEVKAPEKPDTKDAGTDTQRRNHFQERMDTEQNPNIEGIETAPQDTANHPHWPGRTEGTIAVLGAYKNAGGRVKVDRAQATG